MAERCFKHKREMKLPLGNWMKIRTKAPNFALTKELNENTDKSTKFWLKIWQDWALARECMILTLRSIQFCHANNKQVIMRCCSYNYGLIVRVMFGNFAKIGRSCQTFNQNLVLLSVFSFSSFVKAKFGAFVRIFILIVLAIA